MKVSLLTRNRREGSIFVDLDPSTEPRTENNLLQAIADFAGLLVLGAVGLLALVVL